MTLICKAVLYKAQVYINDETKNHKIFTFKMAAKNLAETTKNLKII